ncbi:hypothetical protein B0H10DRAFT_2342507 [Mycena sp. CBHHK59/15]|nr:hypothetical protein B0H10DRAFT_2342507 [Mycena sp. CBHHK59/15]
MVRYLTDVSIGRNAYNALLKVVGPALFLAQPSGPSASANIPLAASALGSVPLVSSQPAPKQSDYPGVPFWYEHQFTTHKNLSKGESNTDEPKPRGSSRAAQGINVAMLYVTDSAGSVIDGVWLLSCGLAPATWNKGSIDLQRSFSAEICEHYPEMRLCADDWKVQYMAKKMYSGWYKTYNNSRGIKSEAGDDDISESKPIKRSYCGDGAAVDSANKRTKVETQSTIPAPEQNNDEASVPVPVDIVNPLLSVSPPASTPSATPPEDAEGLTLDRFFLGAPEWHFVPSEFSANCVFFLSLLRVIMPKAKSLPQTGNHLIPLIERAAEEKLPEADRVKIRNWIDKRNPAKLDIPRLEAMYQKIVADKRLTKSDLAFFKTSAPVPGAAYGPLAPATEAPTARRVLRMIPPIGDDSGKCGPLLEELQLLSKAKGDFFSVCSKVMMFVNERQKKHPQYSGIPFQPFGTVGGLIHCKPHSAFTIGLAVWPEDNPVGMSVEDWANNHPWHCNVMVLMHPPTPLARKVRGKSFSSASRTSQMLRQGSTRLKMYSKSHGRDAQEIGSRVKQVWVNNKRPEHNNDGICLTLALEWMVELVDGGEKGLGIQRNRDGEVIAVKEFRMIDM